MGFVEEAGWNACHVTGIVRTGGQDHEITIPWTLLTGDLRTLAERAAREHQMIAMQSADLQMEEEADKHMKIARNIARWLEGRAEDAATAMMLLGGDTLLVERLMLGIHIVRLEDAARWAEALICEGRALEEELGLAPEMQLHFVLVADGQEPRLFVTRRLMAVALTKGEVPVVLVGREELEEMIRTSCGHPQ